MADDLNTLASQFSSDKGTEPSTDFIIVGDQILDVAIAEEHTFEAEVTSYPVEDGSSISDNIRIMPIKLSITGIISNHPLPPVADKRAGDPNPADSAYRYLSGLRTKRSIFSVTTSLDTFPNMVITSLSIPRKPGGADYLEFTAQLQEVLIVKTEKTTPTVPTAQPPSNKHKPMKTAEPAGVLVLYNRNATNSQTQQTNHLWWDDNIGGWRYKADTDSKGDWFICRGQPYGVSLKDWTANQSDSHWKKVLQSQRDGIAKNQQIADKLHTTVATPNPYDPIQRRNMIVDGHLWLGSDVHRVSATLVSPSGFEGDLLDRAIFGPPAPIQAWYVPE